MQTTHNKEVMTKREAALYFKSNLMPFVRKSRNEQTRNKYLHRAWVVYVIRLYASDRITKEQLEVWKECNVGRPDTKKW